MMGVMNIEAGTEVDTAWEDIYAGSSKEYIWSLDRYSAERGTEQQQHSEG